jgi:hypothetical protein
VESPFHVDDLSQRGKRWTAEEEATLLKVFEATQSLVETAQSLKRTPLSISLRLKKLNVVPSYLAYWEIDEFFEYFNDGILDDYINHRNDFDVDKRKRALILLYLMQDQVGILDAEAQERFIEEVIRFKIIDYNLNEVQKVITSHNLQVPLKLAEFSLLVSIMCKKKTSTPETEMLKYYSNKIQGSEKTIEELSLPKNHLLHSLEIRNAFYGIRKRRKREEAKAKLPE